MTDATSTSNYSQQFGTDLLNAIEAPLTAANYQFLAAWNQFESGSPATQAKGTASFNPFNTEKGEPGSVPFTYAPNIPSYASEQVGVAATASTILQTNMSALLAALRRGDSAMGDAQGLAATPWGSGAGVEGILGGGKVYTPPAISSASTGGPTVIPVVSLPTLPGGVMNPYNWGAELGNAGLGWLGGQAKKAAGGVASATVDGFVTVLEALVAPFEKYLEDAALVLFGFVLFVVGLIMLSHATSSGQTGGGGGGGGGESKGAAGGVDTDELAAAAA